MAGDKEVLFSSFMAGLLLCRMSITYSELCNEIACFQDDGYTLIEPTGDFNKILPLIEDSNNRFALKYNYDETLNNITVYDYLYNLTDENVRRYYGIKEKEISIAEETTVVRKRKLIDRIKRVKAVI